ncbi:hypothetical protein [Bradyrhizobium sp. CER78]|uniref:hypothetical protein n=1 Tax=Bradyrhizobium sp. CER78 TaxID=3039162 RepID=UPI00244D6432|nr:hypothetical protein [Bradyrhizobium sp. CER78]MDH2384160.1 hypothetical protein [Bradyrhizobium sp. CER78]
MAAALLTGVVNGKDDPTNPVDNLIHDLGHDLQSLPIATVNGGNIALGNTASAPVDVDTVVHDLIPITGDHGILNSHGAHIL